ncbi:hypothetical protein ACIP6P_32565 [Streptomyces sp. NPDC088729]|uniref:hypothetical protein n=1 Tax=Streptomyces sp. NPDC088729 TaxID=3365876 RepID=UPI003808225B
MTTTPAPAAELQDLPAAELRRHVSDLQAALREAVQWLSYCGGREAADDPEHARSVMVAIVGLEKVLARTAPASAVPCPPGLPEGSPGMTDTSGRPALAPTGTTVTELIEALTEMVEDVPEAGRLRVSAGGALWGGELDETADAVVLVADAP